MDPLALGNSRYSQKPLKKNFSEVFLLSFPTKLEMIYKE